MTQAEAALNKKIILSDRDKAKRNIIEVSYVKTDTGAPSGIATELEICINIFDKVTYIYQDSKWLALITNHPFSMKLGMNFLHSLHGSDTTGDSGNYQADDIVYSRGTTVDTETAEVTKITAVAESTLDDHAPNAAYFYLSSPTKDYYVWFSVSDNSPAIIVDPAVAGKFGIHVTILDGYTAPQVATAMATAIDAQADFTATALSSVVTVTGISGSAPDAVDSDTATATTMTFSVTTQGVSKVTTYKVF